MESKVDSTRDRCLDVVLASALIAVGIFFGGAMLTVAGGVGVNFASTHTQDAWTYARRRLWGRGGKLNHDLEAALGRAFEAALKELEGRWWQTNTGSLMQRTHTQTTTQVKEAFRFLRREAVGILGNGQLGELVSKAPVRDILEKEQDAAQTDLSDRARQYLSEYLVGGQEAFLTDAHKELINHVSEHLPSRLAFWFGEELKQNNPASDRAWRAFQRLILEDLRASVNNTQASLFKVQATQEEIATNLAGLRPMIDQVVTNMQAHVEAVVVREHQQTRDELAGHIQGIHDHLDREDEHLSYSALYELARTRSERWLRDRIESRRYIPQVYYPRRKIETDLEAFLAGHKVGFVLLGEAGIGKTSLLCHQVAQWRERDELVLPYDAQFGLNSDEDLETRLTLDLQVSNNVSFVQVLTFLEREGRRLVLVVDGLDENSNPAALLKRLCDFIVRYASGSADRPPHPIKVVLSFRSIHFEKTLKALSVREADDVGLFPSWAFQTHLVEEPGRTVETYRYTLDRVDKEQLEEIYEGYRAYEGQPNHEGLVRRFRPLTPFKGLSPTVHKILTHPWYLRMAMEAYDGRRIPPTLWTSDILQAFCERKIYENDERAELVDEMIPRLRHDHAESFDRDALKSLSPGWSRVLAEHEIARSPYLQLVDEGVLLEVPETETVGRRTRVRIRVRFAFDPLFEYLLSEDVLREVGGWQRLTGEHLAGLLAEGKEYYALNGAVELLLTEAAQRGNLHLPIATLNATGSRAGVPVLVQVLLNLQGMDHENLVPILDALWEEDVRTQQDILFAMGLRTKELGKENLAHDLFKRAASVYAHDAVGGISSEDAYHKLAEAQVHVANALVELREPADAAEYYGEAIEIYGYLVTEKGRVTLAGELAQALMRQGVALTKVGSLREALRSFDEADARYRTLVLEEGHTGLEADWVEAIMQVGAALAGSGYPTAAIEYLDAAMGEYQRLVEEQGRTEVADELAQAFMHKGRALMSLGQWQEAENLFDNAIKSLQCLVEEEGRNEFADELAEALMRKGTALAKRRRLMEAHGCYRRASSGYARLVEEEGRRELVADEWAVWVHWGEALMEGGRLREAEAVFRDAVDVYRQLVEEERRTEFADELAEVLKNKALVYGRLELWEDALRSYDEAISWLDACYSRVGMFQVVPDLLRTRRYRAMALVDQQQWDAAAKDIKDIQSDWVQVLEMESPPELWARELEAWREQLRELSDAQWSSLQPALGDAAEEVRRWVQE